ncbi:MAG TPA: MmpS family transport accessory protein [Mycobacterium sp.]|nr:MmpS family transport accessory protein [Mycobacterium sp.]
MDRYSTYSRTSTTARNAGSANGHGARRTGGYTDVETDVVDGGATYRRRAEPTYRNDADVHDYDAYGDVDEYDDVYEYEDPIDRRWIWVAGVAGAILLIAVICTVVILGGGDSGSVSKTIAATTPTTTAQDASTTTPPTMRSSAPPPAPVAPLSPETVTTIAPSPTASAVPAPTEVAPPSPRTITYQVSGTRQLLDLVTVVYTDAQGALQTEFNVALPWSRTVTLDPGVELKSVIATSLTGQLNCAVTDATGATIVAQSTNSMIATCTK